MKKLFFLACLALLSCKKDESDKTVLVKCTVRFRAGFTNAQFQRGVDSLYLEVKGLQSYALKTNNDPCHNGAWGFRAYSEDTITYIPYIIRTERDTIESGVLPFTVSGYTYVKD